MDRGLQERDPSAVAGVGVLVTRGKGTHLFGRPVEHIMVEFGHIIPVGNRFQKEVIAFAGRGDLQLQVVPGGIHLIPVLSQPDQIPGMFLQIILRRSRITAHHGTGHSCPLQQVLIRE